MSQVLWGRVRVADGPLPRRKGRTGPTRRATAIGLALITSAMGFAVMTGGMTAHAATAAAGECEFHACAVSLSAPGVSLADVSCKAAGGCTAVGQVDEAGTYVPVVATETAGAWKAEALATSLGAGYGFGNVSCTSTTSCAAVENSMPSNGSYPSILTGSATKWTPKWTSNQSAPPETGFTDLSCTSSKVCTAVGDQWLDVRYGAVTLNETTGFWGPLTNNPAGFLGSVSCASTTACTAVGSNNEGAAAFERATNGNWGAVTAFSDPNGSVSSVSCTSAEDCTAVGSYGSHAEPFYVTETNDVWGPETELPAPEGYGQFNSVSCSSARSCTAVGDTEGAKGSHEEPIYATETNGVWGKVVELPSPVAGGWLDKVSCASATACTAVGTGGDGFPIYPTEKAGVWQKVARAPKIGSVTPGNRTLGVAWAAPTSDGGSPVAGYTARAVSGTHTFSCTTSTRACVIRGLTNGTAYAVSVVARNAAGSSAPSATKTATPVA